MKRVFQLLALVCMVAAQQVSAQTADQLRGKIEQIVAGKNAVVGVSIIAPNGKDVISLNGDRHSPLQSVFKFHIALAVLAEVDKGKLSLDQKIEVKKTELLPDLWSPLRDENPNGGHFTIARLIQYSVSQSDNVACDILIRLIGTPKDVESYFKKNGISDIAIKFNEENMQAKWENMFENWTTPIAASQTLRKFYEPKNKLLSKKSYNFFWQTMKETSTGSDRLKNQLPKGTVIAHKTGSSGTNKEGLTAATNDMGVVFLPNGKYFIISVFVTDSKESNEVNAKMIADISKATWDHYSTKKAVKK